MLIVIGLLSVMMINETPPGAIPPEGGIGRYLAWGLRIMDFTAGGVVLLYVGNLTERELPAKRVINMLGTLFVTFTIGGILGMVLANTSVLTPVGRILPHSMLSNGFLKTLGTLQFAPNQAGTAY